MNNGETPRNDLLSAYHDGEVTDAEREAVETLLAESADARAELEDYQRISAEIRNLPDDGRAIDVTIDVTSAVLAGIRQPKQRHAAPESVRSNKRRSWRSLLPLGIAGAVAACVLVALGVRMSRDWEPLGVPLADRATDDAAGIEADAAAESAAETMSPEAPMPAAGEMSAAPPEPAALDESESGFYFSDTDARLPEGISVGDMYSYIDQTEEGDIVVVQAYVIDVRRAVDQLQVLLARNEIPTAMVSSFDEDGLNLAATAAQPRNDLAVYVESNPERVKVALEDLRQQIGTPSNSIQGMQIAGVLDSRSSDDVDGAKTLGGNESVRGAEAADEESDMAPRFGEPASRSRASVQDEIVPNDSAEGMTTFGARSTPGMEAPAEAAALPAPSGQHGAPTNLAFQTVLNVSNSAINQELLRQQAAPATPRDEGRSVEEKLAEPEPSAAAKSYSWATSEADQKSPGSERRWRLLLVLQQRPGAVQAPRP